MKNDYITVIKTKSPCNKLVSLSDDGTLDKKSLGHISRATAFTYRVSTPDEMAKILRKIGDKENYSLILGFVSGTEPAAGEHKGAEYRIVSERLMREKLQLSDDDETPTGLVEHEGHNYCTRSKINFEFSSWVLADYDISSSMPSTLVTDDYEHWSGMMDELVPGFAEVGKLFTPSTSGRVQLNDEPAFPNAKGWHCFIQVVDTEDISRFAAELTARIRGHKYGYVKQSKDGKELFRSILDVTTFSPERLVHDGSPTVKGEGLSVAPVEVTVFKGGKLDTTKTCISDAEALEIEEQTGNKLHYSIVGGKRLVTTVNNTLLKMDTEIELCLGGGRSKLTMMREYVESGERKKLRCQTIGRDSSSCNGFIAYPRGSVAGDDAMPIVYDNGVHTRFEIHPDEIKKYWESVTRAWLKDDAITNEEYEEQWVKHALRLGDVGREKLRQAIGKKTRIGLTVLKKQLDDALEEIAETKRRQAILKKMQQYREAGVDIIRWDESALGKVLREVQNSLHGNHDHGYVFSHAGELGHVVLENPKSVRMIQRKHDQGEDYPPMMVIRHYKNGSLTARVSDGIVFEQGEMGDGKFTGPPPRLINMLMDSSPSWAHPLAGLAEFPVVRPDGSIMTAQGYDKQTGLYCVFPDTLCDDFISEPGKAGAQQALQYLKTIVLQGFEFKSDGDIAMAITCLLTMLQKPFVDMSPAYLAVASVQQSGKTTLLSLLFECVHGRPLACESLPESEEETDKRLTSILREGHSATLFDNIKDGSIIENNTLSRYLTAPQFEGRILGKSEMVNLPTDCLLMMTGNNVRPGTDLISRVWPMQLESSTENPMDRSFARKHISEWCEQHRGGVLAAASCILQAYRLSGEVVTVQTDSRFKTLDEMVRAPLEWLGEPDVMPLVEANRLVDEQVLREKKLLNALHNEFKDELFTTGELFQYYSEFTATESEDSVPDALSDFFPKYRPTKISLGRALGKMENRIVDGLKLTKITYEKSKQAPKWRVLSTTSSNGGRSSPPVVDDRTHLEHKSLGDVGDKGGVYSQEESKLVKSTQKKANFATSHDSDWEMAIYPPHPPKGENCSKCQWYFICGDDPECHGDLQFTPEEHTDEVTTSQPSKLIEKCTDGDILL